MDSDQKNIVGGASMLLLSHQGDVSGFEIRVLNGWKQRSHIALLCVDLVVSRLRESLMASGTRISFESTVS